MLRLEDRLRIALGAGMGCSLQAGEVETICGMLVALRRVRDLAGPSNAGRMRNLAGEAIKPFEEAVHG